MTLRIAPGLSLSDEFVTKTTGILAQRRKGKTYTAAVLAEELVAASIPFVALDPTSAWWGLRASADGTKEGLPVTILGGDHGDVPLERTDGKAIAELVVDEPGYYVIDFGLFESGAAEKEFATDFAQRLYRRKGQSGSDFAMHLFIDEADRFVPQKILDRKEGDATMLGAFEVIVRRGGLRGLGTTLISQRAAVVNKNVLEQLDALIVLRVVGPNDQKAIRAYVTNNGTAEQVAALMGSLASLAVGEAWVWEPGEELFKRVRVRQRKTFNSSATPKPGERRVEPRKLASVDLEAIKTRLADAIERAKANDPKLLQAEIAKLRRGLADAREAAQVPVDREVEVQVPLWTPEMDARVTEHLDRISDIVEDLTMGHATANLGKLTDELVNTRNEAAALILVDKQRSEARTIERTKQAPTTQAPSPAVPVRRTPSRTSTPPPDGIKLQPMHRAILSVLAQYEEGRTKSQVGILSGYTPNKAFNNALSHLRTNGLMTGKNNELLQITGTGLGAIEGQWSPLPTGRALFDYWLSKVQPMHKAILNVLYANPNDTFNADLLANLAGYENSKSFSNALSKLRTLELIMGYGSDIQIARILMEA